MLSMSKLIRVKYKKEDEMIFISHLDLQRLLQRAFRRAKINLSYSEGFNPHPKMSYGNALALGVESQGEYVDIEIEDDIEVKEFLERINEQLPDGIKFVKGQEIDPKTPSLSSIIVYGEYIFNIDLEVPLSKEFVKSRVLNFVKSNEIKEIPIISIDKLAVAKFDIFSVILRLTRNIIIKNNISKILFFLITNEPVIKYYIFHSLFFQHQTSKNVLLLYLDRQRPYYNH